VEVNSKKYFIGQQRNSPLVRRAVQGIDGKQGEQILSVISK
jgi:hypothetical protein